MYNLVVYPSELYHHGVVGMKWGVRRSRPSGASSRSTATKARTSKASSKGPQPYTYKSKAQIRREKRRKKVAAMSDDELRSEINRLQMEKQYRELTMTKDERAEQQAKQFIQKRAEVAASRLADQAITYAMNKGFRMLDKKLSSKSAGG